MIDRIISLVNSIAGTCIKLGDIRQTMISIINNDSNINKERDNEWEGKSKRLKEKNNREKVRGSDNYQEDRKEERYCCGKKKG